MFKKIKIHLLKLNSAQLIDFALIYEVGGCQSVYEIQTYLYEYFGVNEDGSIKDLRDAQIHVATWAYYQNLFAQ